MTGRLLQSATALLDGVDCIDAAPRRVGALAAHEGLMLEVAGFPMPLGTNVRVATSDHKFIGGEIVGFHGDRSLIMPFEQNASLMTGARVVAHSSGGNLVSTKSLTSRARSPTSPTTITSQSDPASICPISTDLPTPDPAMIATRCPSPTVSNALIALTPTSNGRVTRPRASGLD